MIWALLCTSRSSSIWAFIFRTFIQAWINSDSGLACYRIKQQNHARYWHFMNHLYPQLFYILASPCHYFWVLSDWFLFISRNAATLKIKLQGFDCRLQLGRLFNHVHGESLVIIGAHSVLGESHVSHTQTVSLRLAKFRRSRNDTLEFEPSFSVVVWNVMHLYENNVRQSAQDSAQQTANYWYPGPVVCLAVKNKWAIVSIRAG